MRWILWGDGGAVPAASRTSSSGSSAAFSRPSGMRRVGLVATASYLPERWMTAAEIAERSGIPEAVIVEKFGLRGKHIAARRRARQRPLRPGGRARCSTRRASTRRTIDVVMYFGSMWRDYSVWQAAPHIAYRVGATNAFAIEYDNVSHGTPIALRVARDLLRAEAELRNVLVVAACRESYLLDYGNEVALHVQLRRRRGRRPARWRQRSQRGARLTRDHQRRRTRCR